MRLFLLLLSTFIVTFSFAQSTDAALNRRLTEYMAANQRLDFEAVLDYVYPKVLKLASREDMIEGFKKAFNNEMMKITLDSMKITHVEPAFVHTTSTYRRVGYSMTMAVQMLDKEKLSDSGFVKKLEQNFATVFQGSAAYDAATQTFHVKGNQFMIAVKEKGQPWTFVAQKKDKALNDFLFPKPVIAKFKL